MGLYETIVGIYDGLFPLDPKAPAFFGRPAGRYDEAVDMGCATGSYVQALAGLGWRARGVDPSEAMLEAARAKGPPADGEAPSFIQGGMLELDAMFERGSLGLVLCAGNTLAHLTRPGELAGFVGQAARVLAPGGRLVLQLLNYERILKARPGSLPELRAGDYVFRRSYRYRDDGLVDFVTELSGEAGVESDVTTLRPYAPGEVEASLSAHGFSSAAYADWSRAAFAAEDSFALVLECRLGV